MNDMKLDRRYPDSKQDDIIDAFMQGIASGMNISNDLHIRKLYRLRSAILFNRGLLWLIYAMVYNINQRDNLFSLVFVAFAVFEILNAAWIGTRR